MLNLISYFRSGWAFLIPYVFVYVLYAWLKWPVNHSATAHPSLLSVYWVLHAGHAITACVALVGYWKEQAKTNTSADFLFKCLPWACLALLFWIPGVYMEFPSDPWQHYARLNEWRWHELVTEHSTWTKSSYFLGYSLIGHIQTRLIQLKWFDLYYTGCCLLLCWQYYRLALAVGLNKRSANVFVLMQALLMGNNMFGFYRYYGMSSTVLAQLSSVALLRLSIETLSHPDFRLRTLFCLRPAEDSYERTSTNPLAGTFQLFIATCALIALTAFNHIQGLGIAAIGVIAVIAWKLVDWKRSMIFWILGLVLFASIATIFWYPRHAFLDSIYRPQGWLTSWYAFNLFTPTSLGFQRAWVIFGLIGALNLAAGMWLISRNHLVGWLTLMPLILLSFPCVSIPFASILARTTDWQEGYIIVFHRMFFAIPTGLALMRLFTKNGINAPWKSSELNLLKLIGLLVFIVCSPANRPWFNRSYNILMRPSADSEMIHILNTPAPVPPFTRLTSAQGISSVFVAGGSVFEWYANKNMEKPPAETIGWSLDEYRLTANAGKPVAFFTPSVYSLYTPISFTGFLSDHWNANQIAIEHLHGPEIDRLLKITPPEIEIMSPEGKWDLWKR